MNTKGEYRAMRGNNFPKSEKTDALIIYWKSAKWRILLTEGGSIRYNKSGKMEKYKRGRVFS